jgi:hypothetical protein
MTLARAGQAKNTSAAADRADPIATTAATHVACSHRLQYVYDEAVRDALTIVWETSDRVCGKRLRPLLPALVDAMERHGHLKLAPEVRPA